MSLSRVRGWYWRVHGDEYERFKVGELPKFCGWDVLLNLIEECERTPYFKGSQLFRLSDADREALRRKLVMRDKALVATAFETGGRISEVLLLRRSNFEVHSDRVVVRDMPVVKRFAKVGEKIERWCGKGEPEDTRIWHWSYKYDAWIRRKYVTKPRLDRRNVLEIPRFEPLTPFIVKWLGELPSPDSWMFPSYGKYVNRPITATRAYQIVRDVGSRCGLRLCCHWFRSMRASQLAEEYGFREFELIKFFSWQSDKYARLYAKLAPERIFELMVPYRIRVGRVEGG